MIRVLAAALILTGCTTTAGQPVQEPETLHCDLIFPAPIPGRT